MVWMRQTILIMFVVCLSGCFERDGLAPVVDGHWPSLHPSGSRYVVRKGDTLYSIAFRYDMDYRRLAVINHLSSPYTVKIGQSLQIRSYGSRPLQARHVVPRRRLRSPPHSAIWHPVRIGHGRWIWPIQGRLVSSFVPAQGKKGINIAGKKGQKVRASAAGVVAYAGTGLSGYGNLIIIKHSNQYLTAYGNNSRNLVVEGQAIKAGQPIAEIGVVDHRYWGVHFEIRQSGQPVNPLHYLR